jgi:hypothetical protein
LGVRQAALVEIVERGDQGPRGLHEIDFDGPLLEMSLTTGPRQIADRLVALVLAVIVAYRNLAVMTTVLYVNARVGAHSV